MLRTCRRTAWSAVLVLTLAGWCGVSSSCDKDEDGTEVVDAGQRVSVNGESWYVYTNSLYNNYFYNNPYLKDHTQVAFYMSPGKVWSDSDYAYLSLTLSNDGVLRPWELTKGQRLPVVTESGNSVMLVIDSKHYSLAFVSAESVVFEGYDAATKRVKIALNKVVFEHAAAGLRYEFSGVIDMEYNEYYSY